MSIEKPLLEVTETRDGSRVRVLLRGEFDVAGVPAVTESLRRLLVRGEDVLLDLDEVDFIDMSGLRVLLMAAQLAADDGSTFAVTPGSEPVRRLLDLVQPDGRLPLDEA